MPAPRPAAPLSLELFPTGAAIQRGRRGRRGSRPEAHRAPGRSACRGNPGLGAGQHEDVQVAIRDAFDAAVRRLEDHVRKHGGKVKAHAVPLHGTVRMVDRDGGFGFVETAQGEVYFHRNSVVEGGFAALEPGSEVRLEIAERESGEGWQATTVRPIGKHHLPPEEP